MTSNGTLIVEALAVFTLLVKAYLGWIIALVATLTVLLLALVAALNTLYDRLRHGPRPPREDASP